jgi:hypothetical protein
MLRGDTFVHLSFIDIEIYRYLYPLIVLSIVCYNGSTDFAN